MTTPLEAALGYLARGWSVVPAHTAMGAGCSCLNPDCESPGKHPRVKWRTYQERHPTEDEVRAWWRRWPDANVAVLTGAISGVVVLDVDPRHGGDDSLADLGALPDTLTGLTGGGGQHLWWEHPGTPIPNGAARRPGLDIRGDGGYVVAPPSVHASGARYTWDAGQPDDPAPLPDVLRALMAKKPPGDEVPSSRKFSIEDVMARGIPEGERNDTLARVAGHYAGSGATYEMVLMSVRGVNATYARPPVGDDELVKIVESIWSREAARSRIATALEERINGTNGHSATAEDVAIPDDRRAMARALWGELGVPGVTDWYLLRSDEVEYVIVTAEDEAGIGDDLLSYAAVSKHVFNKLGKALLCRRDAWPKRAQILRDLAREEITENPRADDRVTAWLDAWVAEKPPQDPKPELRGRTLRSRAITIDGDLHLRPATLADYLAGDGERYSVSQVRKLLRRAGWGSVVIRAGEKTVRAWRHIQ